MPKFSLPIHSIHRPNLSILNRYLSRFVSPLATLHTPLLIWCIFLFFYGLNAGPLHRTESLRAIIGAECLNGHWLYPVLYGEPFLTKPPGHYVAIGTCSLPFGQVNEISARLPSAIAATIVVLLVSSRFRREFGERAGLVAAFLLPTSVLWLDKVPTAEIDMSLAAWVAATLILFDKAIEAEASARPHRSWLWIGVLLCTVAGTLTKWTAPAFFYLTAIPFLWLRGQLLLLLSWRHLLAVAVAGLAFAAWALAVAEDIGWDLLVETIRKEANYRFAPKSAAKGYPWSDVVTYPLLVLASHLPVSLFALRTLRPGFANQFTSSGKSWILFLHCWTWPNLLFWTFVPNHNIRYALPLSPGLMGLGILGFLTWNGLGQSTVPWRSTRWRWLAAFVVIWCIAKVVFVEVVIPRRPSGRNAEIAAYQLRELVPPGEILYLSRMKDEGVMFYYRHPVRKFHDWSELPKGAFAVLIDQEWEKISEIGGVQLVRCMYDQQGDALILVQSRKIP